MNSLGKVNGQCAPAFREGEAHGEDRSIVPVAGRAVLAIVVLILGAAAGWHGRANLWAEQMREEQRAALIDTLIGAHRLFTAENKAVAEFPPGGFSRFAELGRSHLGITLVRPTSIDKLTFTGTRLIPVSGRVAAMFLFERDGAAMSMLLLRNPERLQIAHDHPFKSDGSLLVTHSKDYMIAFVGPFDERSRDSILRSVLGDGGTPASSG